MPTVEDDDSSEEDSPDLLARYSEQWRPVRDVATALPWISSRGDRPDRQLQWGPLPRPAAAGFLIVAVRSFGASIRAGEAGRDLQSELEQTAQTGAAQLEAQPSGNARRSTRPTLARAARVEPEQKTERELESQAARSRSGRVAPSCTEEVPRVAQAAKETESPAATAPTPVSTPSSAPPRSEPDQVALAEPQGSVSILCGSRSRRPGRPIDLAIGAGSGTERAGWTTKAQPDLYWHAARSMQSTGELTLVARETTSRSCGAGFRA